MKRISTLVTLSALVLTAASVFGEHRTASLRNLARDLERVLGPGQVEVTGVTTAEALLADMNREREANGMKPLRLDAQLSRAAGDRASDMFARHYFDHYAPDGTDPFTWVDRRGYRYIAAGENLSLGYKNADEVVTRWMHSPHHRENILKPEFADVGIAVVEGAPVHGYAGPLVVAIYGRN